MKKKQKLSNIDQILFNEAMEDVKPLKQGEYTEPYQKPKKPSASKIDDVVNSVNYGLSDAQDHHTILSDETLSYAISGIQPKLQKNLRAGKIPIEGRLDLHGLTIDQARQEVGHFIYDSQCMNKKCVVIVHGKGSIKKPPLLKTMLNHWLKQIPDVLAFSSAQNKHGGTGAVYLLIKSEKQPPNIL